MCASTGERISYSQASMLASTVRRLGLLESTADVSGQRSADFAPLRPNSLGLSCLTGPMSITMTRLASAGSRLRVGPGLGVRLSTWWSRSSRQHRQGLNSIQSRAGAKNSPVLIAPPTQAVARHSRALITNTPRIPMAMGKPSQRT